MADKGQHFLEMFRGIGPAATAALVDTRLVEADWLYDGDLFELALGGWTVQLRTRRRNVHTQGDQVVFLPAERVLFTGDLAEKNTFPVFRVVSAA
ncbi:hypothetical protein JQ587_28510 [Bradyrhizobium manausense]|nr:hypothetical protein [Bradyrhizobium manausense]